jgi:hypothetical protein
MSNDDKFYGGLRVGAAGGGVAEASASALNQARSFLFRVATGATVEIVPAPPPGFMTIVHGFRVNNESPTLGCDYTVSDALGVIQIGTGTSALAAAGAVVDAPAPGATSSNNAFLLPMSRSAISLSIGGAGGTPCVIWGTYVYVPIGNVRETVLTLTTAFQSISPSCIPSDPKTIAVVLGQLGPWSVAPGISPQPGFGMNGDSAVAQAVYRITRGSITTLLSPTNWGARQRTQLSTQIGSLLQGDTFEVKLTAAPVIPGSIVWRHYWSHIPLQQ